MGLERYRQKRHFARTPEPAGRVGPRRRRGRLFYCIQKHAATRLHYDFRLELDGTLKSWAVPKGPSLDPAARHLAVEVEDHPLDYGDFEGIIPRGQYGGGTVLLWDRGSWEPVGDGAAGLARGKLDFVLHGDKLSGGFTLVRMRARPGERQPSWLLLKRRDDDARPGEEVTELRPESVKSGRSLDQIAGARAAVWQSNRSADRAAPTTFKQRIARIAEAAAQRKAAPRAGKSAAPLAPAAKRKAAAKRTTAAKRKSAAPLAPAAKRATAAKRTTASGRGKHEP